MTETESLIAEVRQLRADVARLHAAHTAVHIRHGWMKVLFKDLSTNPHTQYKVHMWGAIYWLINFPADLLPVLLHAHVVAQAWHLHHADLLDLRQPCDRLRRHVSGRGSVRTAAAVAAADVSRRPPAEERLALGSRLRRQLVRCALGCGHREQI
jgi:hypothetical protein